MGCEDKFAPQRLQAAGAGNTCESDSAHPIPSRVRLLLLISIVPLFVAGPAPVSITRPPRPVTFTVPLFVKPPLLGVMVGLLNHWH
jgi:hypothetical protein